MKSFNINYEMATDPRDNESFQQFSTFNVPAMPTDVFTSLADTKQFQQFCKT
jgi:hypothetical protein